MLTTYADTEKTDPFIVFNRLGVPVSNIYPTRSIIFLQEYFHRYRLNHNTLSSYVGEMERFYLWVKLFKKLELNEVDSELISDYLVFCQDPPNHWVMSRKVSRLVKGQCNPLWRPFLQRTKINTDMSGSANTTKRTIAVLGSFFSFAVRKGFLKTDPLIAMKGLKQQHLRSFQNARDVRRLSPTQLAAVFLAANALKKENTQIYSKIVFIISAMYYMYLRISEVCADKRWLPKMNHFFQDDSKVWWFKTVSKGYKERNIVVCSEMLSALKEWRTCLQLSLLPDKLEDIPLIPSSKTKHPLRSKETIRKQIRNCYMLAAEELERLGEHNEAESLSSATTHWLRHTGISDDVNYRQRPLSHVREDAGHSSISVTDGYIDATQNERACSGASKSSFGPFKKTLTNP